MNVHQHGRSPYCQCGRPSSAHNTSAYIYMAALMRARTLNGHRAFKLELPTHGQAHCPSVRPLWHGLASTLPSIALCRNSNGKGAFLNMIAPLCVGEAWRNPSLRHMPFEVLYGARTTTEVIRLLWYGSLYWYIHSTKACSLGVCISIQNPPKVQTANIFYKHVCKYTDVLYIIFTYKKSTQGMVTHVFGAFLHNTHTLA